MDYDEHLIFESLDRTDNSVFDSKILYIFNQAFIDVVRNSGGKNLERLLIIPRAIEEVEFVFNLDYIIPNDPYNKLAFSIHFFQPFDFITAYDNDYSYYDSDGNEHQFYSIKKWGSNLDYNQMVNQFESINENFIEKGFPIIFVETGVLTEQKKEKKSIEEYLYFVFSMSSAYNGIMACLWDTSQAYTGDMKFYNMENDKWYNEIIKDNFKKISKRRYVNPINYNFMSNKLSINAPNSDGNIEIKFQSKKPIKFSFNVKINGHYNNNSYYIFFSNVNDEEIRFKVGDINIKKEYDGILTFTLFLNAYKKNFNNFIQVQKLNFDKFTTFNNLIVEFEENFLSLDINAYKNALSNYD